MQKNRRLILLISIFLISALNASSLSTDAKIGKKLYMEANCQKCHNEDDFYDAKNEKSKNMKNLAMWVKTCDSFYETGWFPVEQKMVIKYLNEVYYKYK